MKLFPFACSVTLLLSPVLSAQGNGQLINQVLADVDRAANNSYLNDDDRAHLNEFMRQMQDFDRRSAEGNFDKDRLDKAIENLDRFARTDRVSNRDRDILQQDLAALREFRATRGGPYSQQAPYPTRNAPYPNNAPYVRGGGGYQQSLAGRVIQDLNRTAANRRLDDHERNHVDSALRGLEEFDQRLAQGDFDKDRLDKIIENINHLANADRVRGRDRDILRGDLAELRDFRARRGRY